MLVSNNSNLSFQINPTLLFEPLTLINILTTATNQSSNRITMKFFYYYYYYYAIILSIASVAEAQEPSSSPTINRTGQSSVVVFGKNPFALGDFCNVNGGFSNLAGDFFPTGLTVAFSDYAGNIGGGKLINNGLSLHFQLLQKTTMTMTRPPTRWQIQVNGTRCVKIVFLYSIRKCLLFFLFFVLLYLFAGFFSSSIFLNDR
jgi:hypothetical protein